MKQQTFITLFNSIYLVFVILWELLRLELLGGIDGAGRVLILVNVAAFALNIRSLTRNPIASLVMLVWCIYACVNTYVHGFTVENIGFLNWSICSLFAPFFAMIIAYRAFKRDFFGTVKLLFWTLAVFVFLGAVFLRPEIEDYTGALRIKNSLGNVYPIVSCGLSVFGSMLLLNENVSKKFKRTIIVLIILSLAIIILTGTRKAFGACIIILATTAYSYLRKVKRLNPLLILFFLLAIFILARIVMNNTAMGERQQYAFDTNQYDYNFFLKFLGDRAIQYVEGWDQFLDNPLFGIGLMKFAVTNTFFHGLPLHSEYMVQLTECGIVGAFLFLVFNIILIARIVKSILRKGYYLKYYILSAGLLVAILFIEFTSWTYDDYVFHIYYAMIFALSELRYKVISVDGSSYNGKIIQQ